MRVLHELCFHFNFTLLEHQVFADHTLPDVMNLIDDSLEVRRGIVGSGNVDVILGTRRRWSVKRRYRNEPWVHSLEHINMQSGLYSLLVDGA